MRVPSGEMAQNALSYWLRPSPVYTIRSRNSGLYLALKGKGQRVSIRIRSCKMVLPSVRSVGRIFCCGSGSIPGARVGMGEAAAEGIGVSVGIRVSAPGSGEEDKGEGARTVGCRGYRSGVYVSFWTGSEGVCVGIEVGVTDRAQPLARRITTQHVARMRIFPIALSPSAELNAQIDRNVGLRTLYNSILARKHRLNDCCS